jgi:hypothetical protein
MISDDSSSSSSSSSSSDESILGENWKDGLDPWQVEIAEALDDMVDELGRIPSGDVDYVDISPKLSMGMTCSNCIAQGDSGCDWVAVSCAPTGWCKLNLVPVLIRSSSEANSFYQKSAGEENSEDTSAEDDSSMVPTEGDFGVMMPKDIAKDGDAGAPAPAPAGSNAGLAFDNGPTTEGVHLDTPVWDDGKKKRKKRVAKSEEIPGTIRKDAEQRYTLGPWYVPNRSDAHGEWTDPQELQQALWGYVRNGDRDIRLQHNVDIVAGEWLEALTMPYEVEFPMLQADSGRVNNVKFPPGTVFLGVQWKPWAWELVKAGEIRGFSIGGTGAGIEVDLPTADEQPATFPTVQQ